MKQQLNNPEALKSRLREINPNFTDDEFEQKVEKYEQKIAKMNNSLVDKDKLLEDVHAQKKAMQFKAQSEMNIIKQQKDEDVARVKKKKKQIKNK